VLIRIEFLYSSFVYTEKLLGIAYTEAWCLAGRLLCKLDCSNYFYVKRSYEHGVCPKPSRFRYSLLVAHITRSCDVIDTWPIDSP